MAQQYPQGRFKRLLQSKSGKSIANDNTDTVVYLIYMEYLSRLIREASRDGADEGAIQEAHEELMRRFRG